MNVCFFTLAVFLVIIKKKSHLNATLWLLYAFLIVCGQHWGSMAQGNKLYHAVATQTIRRINSFLTFVFLMGFVDNIENIKKNKSIKTS